MISAHTKELWRIRGRRGCENICYGYSGNPFDPYSEKDGPPAFIILTIQNLRGTEAGWLIDNKEINGHRVEALLREYIAGDDGKAKMFYLYSGYYRSPVTCNQHKMRLYDLVYGLYYNKPLDQVKSLHVRLIDHVPCLSLGGVTIFDLSLRNLRSSEKLSPIVLNGRYGSTENSQAYCLFVKEGDDLVFYFHEKQFVTTYDKSLYGILCTCNGVGTWDTSDDALRLALYEKGRLVHIPFSEVVGEFFRGNIGTDHPIRDILRNHSDLGAKPGGRYVYDHLSHNKQNNYPWALALIPGKINSRLTGRDKIRQPYFFLTVYDAVHRKYRVKMGAYALGWERRYLFEDLAYSNADNDDSVFTVQYNPGKRADNPLYVALFEAFKAHIGTGNTKSQLSYLTYWADPQRAHCNGNMLTDMLAEPESDYQDALAALCGDGLERAFDGLPTI